MLYKFLPFLGEHKTWPFVSCTHFFGLSKEIIQAAVNFQIWFRTAIKQIQIAHSQEQIFNEFNIFLK